MAQMAQYAAKPKFRGVLEITKPQWEMEITRAPADTHVVVVLYQSYVPVCRLMLEILDVLAMKYPDVKFIKAVATSCVENFHDNHCPGFFIYKAGEVIYSQVPGAEVFGGLRMTVETMEFVLNEMGLIEKDFEEDPRDKLKMLNMVTKHGKDVGRRHEDDVDDDGDDREYMNNQYQRYR
mmetsp:Transcript_18600/g.23138  ORF Transcript_18600/g.23138 Transcript_18600/m.23138 type:complete len:179 (-) Transcript_18600:86-622(-)